MGILFVLVTHCATVTIWFIEKDIFGTNYPETEEKYISMLVRLVLWLAFFLPHPWWIFVSAFVMVTFGRHVWTRRIDFSWTSVLLGQLIAIFCSAIYISKNFSGDSFLTDSDIVELEVSASKTTTLESSFTNFTKRDKSKQNQIC
jgi:energy-coupling factor transporter transmembrane protein EcfT